MLETALGWLWWPAALLLRPLPLAVLAAAVAFAYWWMTRHFDFWTSRGVPGPAPKLPYGHGLPDPRDFHAIERVLYEYADGRYCGFFELHRPVLYVADPDLIRAIAIKDFEHFTDRRDLALSKSMEEMLVSLSGRRWKTLREAMSPAFSASKLRAMHQLCLQTANNLSRYARETMAKEGRVQLKDAFGRFTMDNIAACGFGVDCNSFRDPDSEFTRHAAQFFKPLSAYDFFRLLVLSVFPRWLGNLLPDRAEPAAAFFHRVVARTIAHRAAHGSGGRRDYLQLLLETRGADGQRAIADSLVATQAVMFLVGGYDTTASLLTSAGYALATAPGVQRRAQREIDQVLTRHGGQLTFDALSEMHYMDRVLSEALRLYPPFMRIDRQCVREYTLPGTELTIPAGTVVTVPVLSLQRDPQYYPDPLKFDPDRFLPEQKEQRHPCVYLPFGSGPRGCLAQRFALFEAKLALVAVLRDGCLEAAEGTPPPPLPLDPGAVVATAREPVYVRLLPRQSSD